MSIKALTAFTFIYFIPWALTLNRDSKSFFLRKEQTFNPSGQCPHLSAVNLLKIASKFLLFSPLFWLPHLLPETLKNRLFASFRAACRAAEKRDYAHHLSTCQTLLRRNLYFSATQQKCVPTTPQDDENKPLTHKDFFLSCTKNRLPKEPWKYFIFLTPKPFRRSFEPI